MLPVQAEEVSRKRRPLALHLHLQAGHGRKRLKRRTRGGVADRPADERQRQRRLPQVRDDRDAAAHAQEVSGAGGPLLPGELHAQPTDRLLLSDGRSEDGQPAPKKPFRGGRKRRTRMVGRTEGPKSQETTISMLTNVILSCKDRLFIVSSVKSANNHH